MDTNRGRTFSIAVAWVAFLTGLIMAVMLLLK
jgi:hypothetical protein